MDDKSVVSSSDRLEGKQPRPDIESVAWLALDRLQGRLAPRNKQAVPGIGSESGNRNRSAPGLGTAVGCNSRFVGLALQGIVGAGMRVHCNFVSRGLVGKVVVLVSGSNILGVMGRFVSRLCL